MRKLLVELHRVAYSTIKRRGVSSVVPRGHPGPDSQGAETWLDQDTFVNKGNTYTINADGKVERKA